MKKLFTAICLLLCFAMVLGGVAACGTPDGPSDETYTVIFNYNYTGAPEAIETEVNEGGTVTKPDDPERDGYLFDCWSTNRMVAREYDFSQAVEEDFTLYAIWKSTSAVVSFDTDGGSAIDDITVDVGGKVNKPADPVKSGHAFGGWYADAACTTPFDFDAAIDDDTTIYAKWNKTSATVTFVVYDGYTGESLDQTLNVVDGAKKATEPEDPVRDRYEFMGWTTDRAGENAFDFDSLISDDITLYAQWKQLIALITLDHNYEGATDGSVNVDIGKTPVMPVVTRTGHVFSGWYTDPACTSAFDDKAAVNGDITVYAKWTPEVYDVSFDLNGASGTAPTSRRVEYGSFTEEPEAPSREGYIFSGWSTAASGGEAFDFAGTPITGNTVFYAQWVVDSGSDTITYTYYLNTSASDNTVYKTDHPTPGNRITIPEPPERDGGWFFDGWYDNRECTGKEVGREFATVSRTLYAKWTPRYTFEAEYTDLDGKLAQGSSDNGSGPEVIIQSPLDVVGNGTEMGMSNGYYVGKLYYNGAFLKFEINASAADDDATLILRLTPDLYDMFFTPDDYKVIVNNVEIDYGELNLDGAYKEGDKDPVTGEDRNADMNKRPFENYEIGNITLKEGKNTIELRTTNSRDHGGTFNAETPLVDCIYIASDSVLTWAECKPENVGQTMADVQYRT